MRLTQALDRFSTCRQNFIKRVWACTVAAMFIPAVLMGQQTADGIVFQDGNGNNKLDSEDARVSEVAVSNGKEVVLTNEEGYYSLPINEDGGKIFVIKPAGYELPLNGSNLPQFYYIHKPYGSPSSRYPGVTATGPLPDSINFALRKTEKKQKYRVILFGDPQSRNVQEIDYLDRDIISELEGTGEFAFGLTLGDIVYNDLNLFSAHNESVEQIGIPWYNLIGNHDINFDADSDRYSDETYEATYGPPTYSFNQGEAHFIILDDVIYPNNEGVRNYIGGFSDRQLTFIRNDLKHVSTDKLIVLAFHIPLSLEEGYFRPEDRKELLKILDDYPNTLSLSAHRHQQEIHHLDTLSEGQMKNAKHSHNAGHSHSHSHSNSSKNAGKSKFKQFDKHPHFVVGTSGGDWWKGQPDDRGIPRSLMRDGTPNGYAMLNIDGNDYTLDYKAANYPSDYRMSIWGPMHVQPEHYNWSTGNLYVNYFLGSSRTDIAYRIEGTDQDWKEMNKVRERDPYVMSLQQKWNIYGQDINGRRPSNPIRSPHLWKADLPDTISPHKQNIEIRVKDQFGRTFRDEFDSFRPNPPNVQVSSGNQEITISWDNSAENYLAPYRWNYITQPFEGYKVYKSTESAEGPWTLVHIEDLPGNAYGPNAGIDYTFTDDDLVNHVKYHYAVTSFTKPDTMLGLSSIESEKQAAVQTVRPGSSPRPEVGDVAVVPNPYRNDINYNEMTPPGDQWTEGGSGKVRFTNLPKNSTIKIYTLAGNLVKRLAHHDQENGYKNWNLKNRSNKSISSGIYLFTVKNQETGSVQTGKFVVIK